MPKPSQRPSTLHGAIVSARLKKSEVLNCTGIKLNEQELIRVSKSGFKRIILAKTGISDISALSSLVGLTHLDIRECPIEDISPLVPCGNLQVLNINSTKVSDITILRNFNNLTRLSIMDLDVNNFSVIADLKELNYIDLDNTSFDELMLLSKATNLRTLYLRRTSVTILNPLSNNRKLDTLWLDDTKVTDLNPLLPLRLRALDISNTLVEDLTPVKSMYSLMYDLLPQNMTSASYSEFDGIRFKGAPIRDETLRKFADLKNPTRTQSVLSYLNNISVSEMRERLNSAGNVDIENIYTVISSISQSSVGVRFLEDGDRLSIQNVGDITDDIAANDVMTRSLQSEVAYKAGELSKSASRISNSQGWERLARTAQRLEQLVGVEPDIVPSLLGQIYSVSLELGSLIELDDLAKSEQEYFIESMPIDIRRDLINLIRVCAPWIRRFPSVRSLDDEAGQFLYKSVDSNIVRSTLEKAKIVKLLSAEDVNGLLWLNESGSTIGYVSGKAKERAVGSVKNLIITSVLSLFIGAVGSDIAPKSVIAEKSAEFYLKAESEIIKVFADQPTDIRLALGSIVEIFGGNTPALPVELDDPLIFSSNKKRGDDD